MATLETIQTELENQRALVEQFNKVQEEKLQAKADNKSIVDMIEKQTKMHEDMEKYADRIDALEAKLTEQNLNTVKEAANKELLSFKNYLRNGDTSFANAVRTDQDADGGLAVPVELDRTIEKLAMESGSMMKICTVITAGPGYQKLVDLKGATVANTVELQIIDNTSTPKLGKVVPVWGKLEAKPLLSQEAIADIFFDVESWVRESVGEVMQDQIEKELLTGNASAGQTKGLLSYDIVETDDATRDFGKFEFIKTGVAGGFVATSAANLTSPADTFMDLEDSLKEAYQNGACFLMNRSTKTAVRKFKNAQADFLWEPRLTLGEPERIHGYPIYTSPYMPAMADDALAVAFGNFKRGLKVVMRPGLYVIRDPYSKKPNVEYSFVKRYGLMLNNSEAIKFMKLAD